MPSRVRPAAVVLVASTTVLLQGADTGSGYFRMDKVTSKMTSACAFKVPHPEKADEVTTTILFATGPIDCAAADLTFDPIGAVAAQVEAARGAYVSLTPSEGASGTDGSWTQTEPYDSMGFGGQGELTHKVRSDTRLEGAYSSKGSQSFFDKSFQFEFTWAVDVRSGALTGDPLPADGGEPGKAYRAYVAAVGKNDLKAVASLLAAGDDTLEFSDAGGAKAVFDMFKKFELKDARITGGLVRGDRAALRVEGTSHDNDKMRGRVLLVRDGGAWKVGKRMLRVIFE
jgi:hypothetical protein